MDRILVASKRGILGIVDNKKSSILDYQIPGIRKFILNANDIFAISSDLNEIVKISAIDLKYNDSLAVGSMPVDFLIKNNDCYISCSQAQNIMKIDINSFSYKINHTLKGYPNKICDFKSYIYVLNMPMGYVTFFNDELSIVKSVKLKGIPVLTAKLNDNKMLVFCIIKNKTMIYCLDQRLDIISIEIVDVSISSVCKIDEHIIAFLQIKDNLISLYDVDSKTIFKKAETNKSPKEIAYDKNSNLLYTCCIDSDCIDCYDMLLNRINTIATIKKPSTMLIL